jgi:cytochrome c556
LPVRDPTSERPEAGYLAQQDFAAKLSDFQRAAQVFNAVAAGNDLNAAKARYADLGGACKACHDKYRTEMHH